MVQVNIKEKVYISQFMICRFVKRGNTCDLDGPQQVEMRLHSEGGFIC